MHAEGCVCVWVRTQDSCIMHAEGCVCVWVRTQECILNLQLCLADAHAHAHTHMHTHTHTLIGYRRRLWTGTSPSACHDRR